MTLTELRVWHWRRAMASRQRADSFEKHLEKKPDSRWCASQMRAAHRKANFHLRAVQALNDVPELRNSTAEQDSDLIGARHKIREASNG